MTEEHTEEGGKTMGLLPRKGCSDGVTARNAVQVDPVMSFRSGFDRVFDRFFSHRWSPAAFSEPSGEWVPSLDVSETDNEIVLRAELAGVDPNDLDISLSGYTFYLRGEKKNEHEEKHEHCHRIERSFGSFQRAIDLPSYVDPDDVRAQFEKGVLTVTLKKERGAAPKKIPVSVGRES